MSQINYFPAGYQDWLFDALGVLPGAETSDAILEPLYHLNKSWTKPDPSAIPPDYTASDAYLRSYTLYYMTFQMPKLWFLLDRCPHVLNAKGSATTICDMGCGPGTFIWAFLFYLLKHDPERLKAIKTVRGIDSSQKCLEIAQRLAKRATRMFPQLKAIRFEFLHGNWLDHLATECDCTIFGNTLVENSWGSTMSINDVAADSVVVIEPGTRESFHHILPIRDQFIANGWHVAFPCTSHHDCPMAKDNWCHFHINRLVLPFIQRMSAKANRINPRHNFVGFVFSRSPAPATDDRWRVLSKLRKSNRSGIRYICDGESMIEVVLNRREKTDGNRAFLDAGAGDAIQIETDNTKFVSEKRLTRNDRVEPALE